MDDDLRKPKGDIASELYEVLSLEGFRAFIEAFGGIWVYVQGAYRRDGSMRTNPDQFKHVLNKADCIALTDHFAGQGFSVPMCSGFLNKHLPIVVMGLYARGHITCDIARVIKRTDMRTRQIRVKFVKDYPHIPAFVSSQRTDASAFPAFWKAVQADPKLEPISNAVSSEFNALDAKIAALPPTNANPPVRQQPEATMQKEMEPTP